MKDITPYRYEAPGGTPRTFAWGRFPPVEQQLLDRPDIHKKRFWKLLTDAVDAPVLPDDGRNQTVGHALTEMLVNTALSGEAWALKLIMDRTDGRSVQGIDLVAASGDQSTGLSAVATFFASFSADVVDGVVVEDDGPTDLELMRKGKYIGE